MSFQGNVEGHVFQKQAWRPLIFMFYYAFPTGSVYGFGMKRRQRRRQTPTISKSASNLKILGVVNKAGLFHILFGLNKF